jgi:hypothetical protein
LTTSLIAVSIRFIQFFKIKTILIKGLAMSKSYKSVCSQTKVFLTLSAILVCGFGACNRQQVNSDQRGKQNSDAAVESKDKHDQIVTDETLDSDNDSLSDIEEQRWGTDPFDPDTDGDGFEDGYEVYDLQFKTNWEDYPHKFNPLIADLPKINIDLTGPPVLTMDFTTSDNKQKSISTGRTQETRTSFTKSESFETSITVEDNVSVSLDSFGVSTSLSASESFGWNESQTVENGQVYSESQEFVSSNTISAAGGRLQITVDVTNPGNIAYTVRSLTLNAVLIDPRSPDTVVPVGNLLYGKWGEMPESTLRTQNRGKLDSLVFYSDLNLETFNRILKNRGNLVVKISGYQLEDENGAIDLDFTNIGAKTAEINIDYAGKKPFESHLVAAFSDNGQGISLEKVFNNILRINQRSGEFDWLIDPQRTEAKRISGLTSIRNIDASTEKMARWVIVHKYQSRGEKVERRYDPLEDSYQFESIMIKPGHHVNLVYLEDADGDGLGVRSEFIYGTDPNLRDTDGDNLDDRTEIEGWQIELDGKVVTVRSNPAVADTDGDGIRDDVEKQLGTDPSESPLQFEFVRQFGSKQNDQVCQVATDEMGNVYFAGKLHQSSFAPLFIAKLNRFGDQQWMRSFAHDRKGAATSVVSSIAIGQDGKIYIAISEYLMGVANTHTKEEKVIERNRLVLRVCDANGNRLSDTIVSTPQTEMPTDIVIDGDGNVYVAGTTSGILSQGRKSRPKNEVTQAFIAKFDLNGKLLWTRQFDPDQVKYMTIIQNKYLVLGGAVSVKDENNHSHSDILIRCCDLEGNEIWSRQFENPGNESFADIAVDSYGNIIVAGTADSPFADQKHHGRADGLLFKLNMEGIVQWTRQFGTQGNDIGQSIVCDSNGRILLVANTTGDFRNPDRFDERNSSKADFVLITYSTNGDLTDSFQYSSEAYEQARDITIDKQGNVYIVGTTNGVFHGSDAENQGSADVFVIKMSRAAKTFVSPN